MMSCYSNKSELFLSAAEMINEKSCFYPAVPHGAYYSCILLMRHICCVKFGKKENEIRNEVNPTLHGTHEIMAEFVRLKMVEKAHNHDEREKAKLFISKIGQLKRIRVRADYGNVDITSTQSSQSISLAKDVLKLLKAM